MHGDGVGTGDGDNVTGMEWGWGCKFISMSIFTNDTKALGVVIDRRLTFRKHHGSSTIVQLSFSGHPPYTPSTVYRTRGDTGLQSHTDQTGLLQLTAVLCSSQQHSGSTASAKQCSQDRSPSSKTISCLAITA